MMIQSVAKKVLVISTLFLSVMVLAGVGSASDVGNSSNKIEFDLKPNPDIFFNVSGEWYLPLNTTANIDIYLKMTEGNPITFNAYNFTYVSNFSNDNMSTEYSDLDGWNLSLSKFNETTHILNDTKNIISYCSSGFFRSLNTTQEVLIGNITFTTPETWSELKEYFPLSITLCDALEENGEGLIDGDLSPDWSYDVNGSSFSFFPIDEDQVSQLTLCLNESSSVTPFQTVLIGKGNNTFNPPLIMPENSGYTFTGYYGKMEEGSKTFIIDDTLNLIANVPNYTTSDGKWDSTVHNLNLYVNWTSNQTEITLNATGGSEGTDKVVATYNSSELNSSIINPKRHGYVFTGWNTSETGGQAIIDINGNLVDCPGYVENGTWINATAKTMEVYAQWNKTTTTEVTLYFNNTSSSSLNQTVKIDKGKSEFYDLLIMPQYYGYTFTGYSSNQTESGESVMVINETLHLIPGIENFTTNEGNWCSDENQLDMYGNWTVNKTSLILNQTEGHGVVPSEVVATYNSSELNSSIINPERDNYEFDGWYTSPVDGSQIIDVNGTLVDCPGYVEHGTWINGTVSSLEVYAQWILKNQTTIILNPMGGIGSTPAVNATEGSSELNSSIINPLRDGYVFTGWSTSETGGQPIIDINGKLVDCPGYVENGTWINGTIKSLEVYAQWDRCYVFVNNDTGIHGLINIGDRVYSTSEEEYVELKDITENNEYVLRLHNFNVSGCESAVSGLDITSSLIWSEVPLTIDLDDSSSNLSANSSYNASIICTNNLNIVGPGSLTAQGNDSAIKAELDIFISNDAHVFTQGELAIRTLQGDINITQSFVETHGGSSLESGSGLYSGKDIVIDNSTVNATGTVGIFARENMAFYGLSDVGNVSSVEGFGPGAALGTTSFVTPKSVKVDPPLYICGEDIVNGTHTVLYDDLWDYETNWHNYTFMGENVYMIKYQKIHLEFSDTPSNVTINNNTEMKYRVESDTPNVYTLFENDIDDFPNNTILSLQVSDDIKNEILTHPIIKNYKVDKLLSSFILESESHEGGKFKLYVLDLPNDKKNSVGLVHKVNSTGLWELVQQVNAPVKNATTGYWEFTFRADSFSPFALVFGSSTSSRSHHEEGTSIILTPTPTPTPTVYPTDTIAPYPSYQPTSVQPTTEPGKSPAPFCGLAIGLATAGLLLTRLRK